MEPLASLVLVSALVCAWAISSVKSQHLVWFVVAVLHLGAITPALAVCDVNDTATVTEDTKLQWGTLQIPTSGSNTCIVNVGSADCAAGSTGSRLFGIIGSGSYTVTKDNALGTVCAMSIDIVNISTGSSDLTLGSITGKYDGVTLSGPPPWTGLTKPNVPRTLELGMTATYASSITPGTYTPIFGIKVTFDPNAAGPTTSNMSASARFDMPITIDNVVNINFGNVQGNTGNIYTMNTAGTVTPSGGGVVYAGSRNAGSLKIHGSSTQTLTIYSGFYSASSAGGATVTPSAATCAYNGGASVACDFPG